VYIVLSETGITRGQLCKSIELEQRTNCLVRIKSTGL